MKILIGQFSHESNSFAYGHHRRDRFRALGIALWRRHHRAASRQTHGAWRLHRDARRQGLRHPARRFPPAPCPRHRYRRGFYRDIKARFVDAIRDAPDLTGVMLSLHGGDERRT